MRLTPLDIQNHRFSHRLRGYDTAEVDAFVRLVGEDYESLVRELDGLRVSARALELRVAELSGQEGRLKETLVTVQTMTDDLKRTSIREAEMKVAEAEVRAEKILDAAHRRTAKLQEEIRELRLLRGRVAAAMRATLDTHRAMLDSLLDDSAPGEEAASTQGSGWQSLPVSDRPETTPKPPLPAPA